MSISLSFLSAVLFADFKALSSSRRIILEISGPTLSLHLVVMPTLISSISHPDQVVAGWRLQTSTRIDFEHPRGGVPFCG